MIARSGRWRRRGRWAAVLIGALAGSGCPTDAPGGTNVQGAFSGTAVETTTTTYADGRAPLVCRATFKPAGTVILSYVDAGMSVGGLAILQGDLNYAGSTCAGPGTEVTHFDLHTQWEGKPGKVEVYAQEISPVGTLTHFALLGDLRGSTVTGQLTLSWARTVRSGSGAQAASTTSAATTTMDVTLR